MERFQTHNTCVKNENKKSLKGYCRELMLRVPEASGLAALKNLAVVLDTVRSITTHCPISPFTVN